MQDCVVQHELTDVPATHSSFKPQLVEEIGLACPSAVMRSRRHVGDSLSLVASANDEGAVAMRAVDDFKKTSPGGAGMDRSQLLRFQGTLRRCCYDHYVVYSMPALNKTSFVHISLRCCIQSEQPARHPHDDFMLARCLTCCYALQLLLCRKGCTKEAPGCA
jgi:hypothetical protein